MLHSFCNSSTKCLVTKKKKKYYCLYFTEFSRFPGYLSATVKQLITMLHGFVAVWLLPVRVRLWLFGDGLTPTRQLVGHTYTEMAGRMTFMSWNCNGKSCVSPLQEIAKNSTLNLTKQLWNYVTELQLTKGSVWFLTELKGSLQARKSLTR